MNLDGSNSSFVTGGQASLAVDVGRLDTGRLDATDCHGQEREDGDQELSDTC